MSETFSDDFETGDLSAWTAETGSPAVVSTVGLDMFGDWCFLAGSGENVIKVIPGSSTYEFYLYVRPTGSNVYILTCFDGTNRVGRIRIESNKFTAYVGTSLVATGTITVNTSTTYHLKVYFKVADSGGKIQLWVDDVLDIDYTGDTKPVPVIEISRLYLDSDSYIDNVSTDDACWSIIAEPIEVDIDLSGTYLNLGIAAEPIEIDIGIFGSRGTSTPKERDPTLDQTFDCRANDGIPEIIISVHGEWFNKCIIAEPIDVVLSQHGKSVEGVLVTASPIDIVIDFKDADVFTQAIGNNWVKWSNIGELDFTIGRDNVAGERPLDWKGWVYDIRKLGNKVIAYGENGVSILNPSGNTYGLNTIYRIGLKSKQAVTGDDLIHFFIDNRGRLYSLGETLQKLDYSEYLSALASPVMSHDVENELVYICDGSLGYVYSIRDKSLGEGPVNITGISSQDGTLHVVAPAAINVPVFQICTDILDFGTRRGKNIESIEIGTDLTETLEAAIDYRIDKAAVFATTDWHTVDARGFAYIPVHVREARIRLRSTIWSAFDVDYINIVGEVCTH